MRRFAPVVFAALALAPLLASAGEPPIAVPVTRFQLGNGLTVLLHEDHSLPTVVVDIWFRVGSKDERAGRTGFAHLFEHLMFMGTAAVPNGQYDAIMEAVGGQNNATTSEDRTNYFESGPSNLLETFLWLEADRLATLSDDMTKEKVDLQRDVVKNERRQSYENRPYGMAELALSENSWPKEHAYHHPVIGSHEDLTAASVDDVKNFFHDFYVPSNATLAIVGDFDPQNARALVEKYFGRLSKKNEPPHAAPAPFAPKVSTELTLKDAVQLERATVAFHSPPSYEPGDAECDLLAAILGSGKSSRLYQALVYDQKIAQQVQVEQRSMRYGSLFLITATATPGHTAGELEKAIAAELARLDKTPPTERELERARALVETMVVKSIEPQIGMADLIDFFDFRFHDPGEIGKRLLSRYGAATVASVSKQGRAMFSAPHLTLKVVPR
jgi:predicted Zn-dependent peptidase